MNVKAITRHCAWFTLAILVVFLSGPAHADPYKPNPGEEASPIFVFGDSLSDPGNVAILTGLVSTAPFSEIPSAPYDSNRFTNGETWAEELTRKLRRTDSGLPVILEPQNFGNYAFGGARARVSGDAPSLTVQVGMFLAAKAGVAPSDALYIVEFGGNDIRDALEAAATGDIGASFAIMGEAVQTTVANIVLLYESGARKFLLANVPNLGNAPAIIRAGAAGTATFFSGFYNGTLEGGLQTLEGSAAYPDIEILRLDIFGFIDAITATPEAFGFADAATPCLRFDVLIDTVCDEPDNHVFWDGIHPTAAAQQALGNAAVKVLRNSGILDTADE
jgi:phospholipase/lecithinase/hemolysin